MGEDDSPRKIHLGFDPKETSDEGVKRIFENRLARILWAGIKSTALTDERFPANCLGAAEYMENKGVPKDVQKARFIMKRFFGLEYVDMAEKILPYLTGEKEMEFYVKAKFPN
ncbi:MAG: hypothetical protein AABW51_01360 [Nanoarchaeota archaeon]